jgi:transitional endoplasmic reticulum ATPase
LTASECEKHGWTFILVDKVQALEAAMKMANRYSPAVVFAEDIDRVLAERDDKANNLINTISGVTSPGQQVMLVLTTNHLDKIDPVILRPGRLDAIISLRPPRLEACGKLIRHYAGNLLAHDAVLDEAAAAVAGMIPAAIREIVERAKLAMISRGDTKLAGNDIVVIATNIKNHLALLEPKPEGQTAAEKLAQGLKDVILNGHGEIIEVTGGTTIATKRLAERIAQRVGV